MTDSTMYCTLSEALTATIAEVDEERRKVQHRMLEAGMAEAPAAARGYEMARIGAHLNALTDYRVGLALLRDIYLPPVETQLETLRMTYGLMGSPELPRCVGTRARPPMPPPPVEGYEEVLPEPDEDEPDEDPLIPGLE